jgi:hypothetical protein
MCPSYIEGEGLAKRIARTGPFIHEAKRQKEKS